MSLVSQLIILVPNFDGTGDGGYPGGDKPQTTPLAWSAAGIATLNAAVNSRTQGTGAFFHNVRSYITGSAAATATISIVNVIGNAATAGWSIVSDELVNNGTTVGDVTFVLRADDGIAPANSTNVHGVWVAPPSTNFKRWHPGHYIRTNHRVLTSTDLSNLSGNPQFKGIDIEIPWGLVQPTTTGDYDWSLIDNALAALPSGKTLIAQITYKLFNTSSTTNLMPSDIMSFWTTSNGFMAKVGLGPIMDRYITLLQAAAARYDSNPKIELWLSPESSSGLSTPLPSDFDKGDYAFQLKRMYQAMRDAFLHTLFVPQINFTSGQVAGLISSAYGMNVAMGDPDAYDTNANSIFKGGASDTTGITSFDYRGLMPRVSMASTAALGGAHNNGPPSNIIDWMQLNGTTHGMWVCGLASPNSTASIVAAINADPTLPTACPANLNGTCLAT